jgi:hypothetical protein
MDIKEVIGNNIKLHRIAKNLSQEQLANDADIDRTYLHNIGDWKVSISDN